jgi:hypothetical protein
VVLGQFVEASGVAVPISGMWSSRRTRWACTESARAADLNRVCQGLLSVHPVKSFVVV